MGQEPVCFDGEFRRLVAATRELEWRAVDLDHSHRGMQAKLDELAQAIEHVRLLLSRASIVARGALSRVH